MFFACHAERSEASECCMGGAIEKGRLLDTLELELVQAQILRCAQDDKGQSGQRNEKVM